MKTCVQLNILRESVIYLSYRFANMLPESAYVCLQVIKTLKTVIFINELATYFDRALSPLTLKILWQIYFKIGMLKMTT